MTHPIVDTLNDRRIKNPGPGARVVWSDGGRYVSILHPNARAEIFDTNSGESFWRTPELYSASTGDGHRRTGEFSAWETTSSRTVAWLSRDGEWLRALVSWPSIHLAEVRRGGAWKILAELPKLSRASLVVADSEDASYLVVRTNKRDPSLSYIPESRDQRILEITPEGVSEVSQLVGTVDDVRMVSGQLVVALRQTYNRGVLHHMDTQKWTTRQEEYDVGGRTLLLVRILGDDSLMMTANNDVEANEDSWGATLWLRNPDGRVIWRGATTLTEFGNLVEGEFDAALSSSGELVFNLGPAKGGGKPTRLVRVRPAGKSVVTEHDIPDASQIYLEPSGERALWTTRHPTRQHVVQCSTNETVVSLDPNAQIRRLIDERSDVSVSPSVLAEAVKKAKASSDELEAAVLLGESLELGFDVIVCHAGRLVLRNQDEPPKISKGFIEWPHLEHVDGLHLVGNPLGYSGKMKHKAAETLAQCRALSGMNELVLYGTGLDTKGLLTLFGSPHLTDLVELHLGSEKLTPEVVEVISRRAHWSSMKGLSLDNCLSRDLDRSLSSVSCAVFVGSLEHLSLRGNKIDAEALKKLLGTPLMENLRELYLGPLDNTNPLGDEGALQLASSPALVNLRVLDIESTGVGDEGARALARSEHLAGLELLILDDTRLSEVGQETLRSRFGQALELRTQVKWFDDNEEEDGDLEGDELPPSAAGELETEITTEPESEPEPEPKPYQLLAISPFPWPMGDWQLGLFDELSKGRALTASRRAKPSPPSRTALKKWHARFALVRSWRPDPELLLETVKAIRAGSKLVPPFDELANLLEARCIGADETTELEQRLLSRFADADHWRLHPMVTEHGRLVLRRLDGSSSLDPSLFDWSLFPMIQGIHFLGDDAGYQRGAAANALTKLADSPEAHLLQELVLYAAGLSPKALSAFAESKHLTGLREVHIGWESLSKKSIETIATATAWRKVHSLSLDFCCDAKTEKSLVSLRDAPFAKGLRYLSLRGNSMSDSTLVELLRRRVLPGLEALLLGPVEEPNLITDEGVIALVSTRAARSLRILDLSACELGVEGVNALLTTPHLSDLEQLVLIDAPLSDSDREALTIRFGDRVVL